MNSMEGGAGEGAKGGGTMAMALEIDMRSVRGASFYQ